MKRLKIILFVSLLSTAATAAFAEDAAKVEVDAAGTATVTQLKVPLSSYMSEEAKKAFIETAQKPIDPAWMDSNAPIDKLRTLDEAELKPQVDRAMTLYPVNVENRQLAGVPTRVITPKSGIAPRNKNRVLIELHGGGFFTGAGGQALLESIPLASIGGYKVIAVNYRQGPEHKYPAATEDVVSVYKALLKDHAATDIGIFGCSAGGSLTAMAVASFQKQGLPKPGAIGLFGSPAFAGFLAPPSAPGAWGGDSRFTAPVLVGEPPQPIGDEPMPFPKSATGYLQNVDLSDPLVSPGMYPDILAKFPPTLILTGTRAFDMSAAIQTHRELVKAGVEAQLSVWDGMGHCFFGNPNLPESREAFSIMAKFFDHRLQ